MWYGDPVDLGWAKSLARPGGNITGTHNGAAEVNLKRMQLLKALVPSLSCVGWIAFEPNLIWFPTFERAAHAAGLRVRKVILREAQGAFEETKRQVGRLRSEGCPAAHFHSGVPAVVDAVTAAARESRLVLSYSGDPAFADREGILFIYEGQVQTSGYGNAGRLAAMVARILRGERPADISFEGPTGYHLKLNLRTAARIGVSVPLEMRVLANEVV
jgi:putative ABC transport system substrate-binding protein